MVRHQIHHCYGIIFADTAPHQNMPKPLPGQPAMYSGMLDCFAKTVASEGPAALYQVDTLSSLF